jgi:hypothetical protein
MLRRAALVAMLAGALLPAGVPAASADPGEGFGEAVKTGPDTVRIRAGVPGRPGVAHQAAGTDRTGCIYVPITIGDDPQLPERYRDVSGNGTWIRRTGCNDPGLRGNFPVNPAGPFVDPAVLAQEAMDKLKASTPVIHTSPSSSRSAVVNFPTWMWVAPESWTEQAASAEEGDVIVTAVARPQRVVWNMGDGATVTCTGPGTPYAAGVSDPDAPSPDCGHTYRRSSAEQPGERFRLTATLTWDVTWSVQNAAGGGALADLTTSNATTLRVAEYQALNTRRP